VIYTLVYPFIDVHTRVDGSKRVRSSRSPFIHKGDEVENVNLPNVNLSRR
jgi:hypothetical protein